MVQALEHAGIEQKRSLELAEAILAQTNSEAIADPKRFLRYAFSAAGFSESSAEAAADAAIEHLTKLHGEMKPVAGHAATVDPAARVRLGKIPHYAWYADAFGFISAAFHEIGMTHQEAADQAMIATSVMDLQEPDSARNQREDSRQHGPRKLLVEAFMSLGHAELKADALALVALGKLNVPGYLPLPAQRGMCIAYPVKVIWCNAQGEPQSRTTYIGRNSWDDLLDAMTGCPAPSICAGEWWYELTLSDENCLNNNPPIGTCIWIRAMGEADDFPCSNVLLNAACFDETAGTIDCEEIEQRCGDPDTGPDDPNCPACA